MELLQSPFGGDEARYCSVAQAAGINLEQCSGACEWFLYVDITDALPAILVDAPRIQFGACGSACAPVLPLPGKRKFLRVCWGALVPALLFVYNHPYHLLGSKKRRHLTCHAKKCTVQP